MTTARDFLHEHRMEAVLVDPVKEAAAMAEDMRRGLEGGESSMPMIVTYLSNDGQLPAGAKAVVIDAGGTNFRSALVSYDGEAFQVEQLNKWKMPGAESPCSWEDFISFTADKIQPLLTETDLIGFCFSYNAEITPEMDGRVVSIDKEVVVTGCEGQLVGRSLVAELERRGIKGKRAVIVNDTVAVLLGGAALIRKSDYSGFIGQVSGTGTNTCVSVDRSAVKKLDLKGSGSVIINMEAGMYEGIAPGDFDLELDRESKVPGSKLFEKKTAGVYLGELSRLMLRAAAGEGLLSREGQEKAEALPPIDTSVVDAWASGEKLDMVAGSREDGDFVREISLELLQRSARCMAADLLAIGLLTGAGNEKPIYLCAEGSLVQRSRHYRPALLEQLEQGRRELGIDIRLHIGNETTLSGSAAAAILNA